MQQAENATVCTKQQGGNLHDSMIELRHDVLLSCHVVIDSVKPSYASECPYLIVLILASDTHYKYRKAVESTHACLWCFNQAVMSEIRGSFNMPCSGSFHSTLYFFALCAPTKGSCTWGLLELPEPEAPDLETSASSTALSALLLTLLPFKW